MNQIDFDPHELINEANASGGAYHKMTFPDGTVLNGAFDMSKYLSYYNLPDDLSGKTVLEAGTANGYFATELYKLGPKKVTAIDFRTGKTHQGINYLMKTNVEFVAKDILKILSISHCLGFSTLLADNLFLLDDKDYARRFV